ncbi:MAG: TRAP transporter large permease subunit [Acetobacteraceae bacterium]
MLAAAKRALGVGPAEAAGTADDRWRGRRLGPARRAFRATLDFIDLISRAALIAMFSGELGLILIEILRRELFDQSFLWLEEVSRIVLLAIAFIGGPLAYREHSHAAVAFITRSFRPVLRAAIEAGIDVVILCIGVITAAVSVGLLKVDSMSILPITQWNLGVTVVPFLIGMSFIVLFALERLILHHRPASVLRGVFGVGLITVLVLVISWVPSLRPGNGLSLVLMLAAFFALILLGLPVAFSMLVGTILYLSLTGAAPMVAVAQTTINGAGLFVLLTIPFFIWAGLIMERGGISLRLVRFAMATVGHLRGGLQQVVIVTTFLVAGVSGSKLADVMAVGSIMREQLVRNGYRVQDGAGVLAAATAMSESIPPSISMLVLGSVVPVSIGQMFVAGLLPAALLAAILMVLVWFIALRHPIQRMAKATGGERARAAVGALLPLAMPAILIIGIKGGIATPTEVSSVAVFYGIALAVLVYRQMNWQSFISTIVESAVMSGMVLFMIAAAGSFAWAMANGNMPQYLLHLLRAAGDNRFAFLAGTTVIVIIVGSLLEGIPALLILAPILYPAAVRLGIDGVQYAMVLVLAMGVGIFLPPVGIGFFASCSVMHASVEDTSKAVLPYMLALLIGILVLAYVPWFSLVLLNLFGR